MLSAAFIATVLFALRVSAQSPVWGQCGGQGWTGATTCQYYYVIVLKGPTDTSARCFRFFLRFQQSYAFTLLYSNIRLKTWILAYYSQCIPGSVTTTQQTSAPTSTSGSSTTASSPAPTDATNPYVGYTPFILPYYAAEVNAAAAKYVKAIKYKWNIFWQWNLVLPIVQLKQRRWRWRIFQVNAN